MTWTFAPPTVASVSWSPAAMPATFVAWSENSGSNGVFAYFHAGVFGSERLRDDHLRRGVRGVSLREARRVGEAARVEEHVGLVEPVVEDRDLHAVARRGERRPPDCGCADQLRRAVQERVVGEARPDGRARHGTKPRELRARDDDGEPVEDDAVAPVHLGARDRSLDPGLELPLRRGERAEVRDARRRAEVEAPVTRRARREPAVAHDGLGERRLRQGHDDLDERPGGIGEGRERAAAPAAASSVSDPRSAGRTRAKRRRERHGTRGLSSTGARLHCPSARMWRNW